MLRRVVGAYAWVDVVPNYAKPTGWNVVWVIRYSLVSHSAPGMSAFTGVAALVSCHIAAYQAVCDLSNRSGLLIELLTLYFNPVAFFGLHIANLSEPERDHPDPTESDREVEARSEPERGP